MLRFPVGVETAQHCHSQFQYHVSVPHCQYDLRWYCGDVCENTTNIYIFFSPVVLFFEQPVTI